MFTSKVNRMTGGLDWEVLDEDYDYQQELARAGFADMLHDYERNRLYYTGLKKVIGQLKSQNKPVNVLDIGTGTGLLSMMAIRCGADTVTACEAFKPMASVACRCIEANGMKDRIKIIAKRSTEILMGVDMEQRANVLVTEVFDTELIGEGAISTFTHALENLLTEDCFVVPDNAIMYVQVVDSPMCHDWNWLNLDRYGLRTPPDYANLAGESLFDIQLAQFKEFKALSEPLVAFEFSFSGQKPLSFSNQNLVEAVAKSSGKAHGVLMWWVCHMDRENQILMSCAPVWAHHTPNNMQWRDHWMQAIYFPKEIVQLEREQRFFVQCNHDEYSLWFNVSAVYDDRNLADASEERSLGLTLVSRNRMAQLNDAKINDMFIKLLKKYEDKNRNLLIVNDDFSLLPLLAATNATYNKIFTLEPNKFREKCLQSFLKENKLCDKIKMSGKSVHDLNPKDVIDCRFDIILSECSFNFALLPWDNLYFYYGLENLGHVLESVAVSNNKIILPFRITFKTIAVSLENLDKIRSPVGITEGFDLAEFDKIILEASKQSDGFLEPHSLWEYPSVPLSSVHEIFSFDFNSSAAQSRKQPTMNKEIKIDLTHNGLLNGMVIWYEVDYNENTEVHSDPEFKINAGLVEEPEKNKSLVWNTKFRQAVNIFDKKYVIEEANRDKFCLKCFVNYDLRKAKFEIDFKAHF